MITQLLRKVRAALIITAIWVLFWTPFAVGLNQILSDILFPNSIDSPYTPVSVWAIWGALCGLTFAVLLALTERGRAVGWLSAHLPFPARQRRGRPEWNVPRHRRPGSGPIEPTFSEELSGSDHAG